MSWDTKIAPIPIGTATPGSRVSSDPPRGASPDAQKLARLANEFESMLLVQMLREMRKSGKWEDEQQEKDGFGAATLFDTLDVELATFAAKAQGFGLEKSLVKQVTGTSSSGSSDPPQGAEGAVMSPVIDRVETSPFGWRRDPLTGATAYHRGVDLRAAYGEPIGSADAGTVVFAGEQRGYGQTVVVEHAGGVRTRYAHLSSLMTEAGAEVKAGDPIGRAGRSGRATGTHLHFEVTRDGQPIDPHTFGTGGLKTDRVLADWGAGTGPTLPGAPSEADQRGSASE